MKKYRILHILTDLRMGGAQWYILRHAGYMDGGSSQHFVCSVRPELDMEPMFSEAGIGVVCLDYRNGWHGARTLYRLVRFIRKHHIDLVHINNTRPGRIYGQTAAFLTGVPVVNTLHTMRRPGRGHSPSQPRSSGDEVDHNLLFRMGQKPVTLIKLLARGELSSFVGKRIVRASRVAFEHWLARRVVKHVIAVSDPVQDSWNAYLSPIGLSKHQLSVIYAGLSIEEFAFPPDHEDLIRLRGDLGVLNASSVLINVAMLRPDKGQRWLIPMMRKLLPDWPGAKLLIVGEGTERANLAEQIHLDGLDDSISLLGERHDVAKLLAISDLFVFTSYLEALGIVVLEAMAAGKPVVAFRLPPLSRVIEEGVNGHMVDTEDVDNLAMRVLDILKDPERKLLMGVEGQRIVRERFELQATAESLHEVYKSVLENRGQRVAAPPGVFRGK